MNEFTSLSEDRVGFSENFLKYFHDAAPFEPDGCVGMVLIGKDQGVVGNLA